MLVCVRRERAWLPAMILGAAWLAQVGRARASEMAFEANSGQADPQVRFVARGPGYALFLTSAEAVFAFPKSGRPVRMRLAGARRAAISGAGLRPGKSHYFLGNDPARWARDVASFERVRYEGVYPGIDLLLYGNQGNLEYDFVVAAGSDPRRIELELPADTAAGLDPEGNLVLAAGSGTLLLRRPVAYQVYDGTRREVASHYMLRAQRRLGFEVATYDATRPLVIDPTISYSSYLGGSGADVGHAIALDASGNVYVAGQTGSADFPGAASGSFKGVTDAFVTKFDPSGTTRLYSVYLGGDGADIAWGIAVDAAGNAYVTGETGSSNFPTTVGAFQRVKKATARANGFVTKLDATGALAYSTCLGGTSSDQGDRGNGIAVDAGGGIVVVGRTDSMDFPVTAGAFFTFFRGDTFDAFVTKLNPAASGAASLVYSTFLGGSGNDAAFGVALDSAGNVHVTGGSGSFDFPTTLSSYQGSNTAGSTDAFYTKLNSNATQLLYSTYIGGSNSNERANGIALDAAGQAMITGQTRSSDFPTKNAIQPNAGTPAGGDGYDAFVAKFDSSLSGDASLVYSTYIGGTGDDIGRAIAADPSGRVYVTGQTASNTTFPIANAAQPAYGGGNHDAFVTKINAAGTAYLYSTYLGGSGDEGIGARAQGGYGIAASPCGDVWVTGTTFSTDFPTTLGSVQAVAGGTGDAYVTKIADLTVAGVVPQWGPVLGGSGVTIVGGCFQPGATATFGGAAATGVTVLSPTAIAATTPAQALGTVDVVVKNPGAPAATRTGGYIYGATGFFPLSPCRIVDTRSANGPLSGPALSANTDRTFAVTGACGIPATAGAISVNIAVTQPSVPGHLRLYPGGTPVPLVASINYSAGQTRANNATVPLGPGGTVTVRCVQVSGTVQFFLDVNGYYQ